MKQMKRWKISGLSVALSIPVSLWSAYATVLIWRWFVVPFGLPPLSLAWAVGLGCLVANFKTRKLDDREPLVLRDEVRKLITHAVGTGLLLLVARIALGFMP